MTDLQKLEHFVAVARYGNYARAAAHLHLSQPALSRSIQALEHSFGCRLIDRERGRGNLELTDAGHRLLRHANAVLAASGSLHRAMRDQQLRPRASTAFGLGPMLASVLLSPVLADMLRARPDIQTTVLIGDSDTMAKRLLEGDIEYYIGLQPPHFTSTRIQVRQFGHAGAAFYVREAHPLAGRTRIEAEDIAEYPILSGTAWPELAYMASNDAELRLYSPSISLDNYGLLEEMAASTDGIMVSALMPPRYPFVRLPYSPPSSSVPGDIHILTLKGIPLSALAEEFLNQLQAAFQEVRPDVTE